MHWCACVCLRVGGGSRTFFEGPAAICLLALCWVKFVEGDDAADTNADKGNLSSGGKSDSTTTPPRELPYEPVVTHTLQSLRNEIGTDEAPADTAPVDESSAPETEPDDTAQTPFTGWSENTLIHAVDNQPIQNYVRPPQVSRTQAEWRRY
eukprot:COSAG01_NODE_35008_length_538_cov_1.683371_1_plen_150_part_10